MKPTILRTFLSGWLLVSLFSFPAIAQQSEVDAVKATINRMFDAMKQSDSAALRSCFTSSVIFQSVRNEPGKPAYIGMEQVEGFIKRVGTSQQGSLDERIDFGQITVDGPLAQVATPYKFYYQGKFSHCGVNFFQLFREGDGWKIAYIIDTRRKEGCTP